MILNALKRIIQDYESDQKPSLSTLDQLSVCASVGLFASLANGKIVSKVKAGISGQTSPDRDKGIIDLTAHRHGRVILALIENRRGYHRLVPNAVTVTPRISELGRQSNEKKLMACR